MAKNHDEPDLKSIAADVKELKHDSRSQGNMLSLIMYSQAPEFAAKVVKTLVADPVILEIFVRVDGVVTKDTLIKTVVGLKLKGGGRASVYAKFVELERLSMVEPVAEVGNTGIYKKSVIATGLRIEQDSDYIRAVKSRPKPGK